MMNRLGKLIAPYRASLQRVGFCAGLLALSLAATRLATAEPSKPRVASRQYIDRLKQLGIAMHNFHEVNKHFPPAVFRDKEGKALLSWRVHILPFLEENDLYHEFHLNEPWDSEHNKKLIEKIPAAFAAADKKLRSQGTTTIVVPVGKQTIFGSREGTAIKDVTDGLSSTVLILDVPDSKAVVWTKPDDLAIDGVELKKALFGGNDEVIWYVAGDASPQRLYSNNSEADLRAACTGNAND
jgi:Protein of unknown function (DUF1559)